MPNLADYAAAGVERLIGLVEDLVLVESPTDDPAGIERAQRLLEAHFRDAGAQTELVPGRDGYGPHLLARAGQGPSQLLVIGHARTDALPA